jgi:hypothetical protein
LGAGGVLGQWGGLGGFDDERDHFLEIGGVGAADGAREVLVVEFDAGDERVVELRAGGGGGKAEGAGAGGDGFGDLGGQFDVDALLVGAQFKLV